jgi:hypothetical protein
MLKSDLQKISALLNSKTRNTRTRINLFRVEARRNNNKISRYLRLLSRVLDLKLRKLNELDPKLKNIDKSIVRLSSSLDKNSSLLERLFQTLSVISERITGISSTENNLSSSIVKNISSLSANFLNISENIDSIKITQKEKKESTSLRNRLKGLSSITKDDVINYLKQNPSLLSALVGLLLGSVPALAATVGKSLGLTKESPRTPQARTNRDFNLPEDTSKSRQPSPGPESAPGPGDTPREGEAPGQIQYKDKIGSMKNIPDRIDPQKGTTEREFYLGGKGSPFNYARTREGIKEFGRPGIRKNQTTITLKNGKKVTVNKAIADRAKGFLNELIDRGYKMDHVSSYNPRTMRGGKSLSMHSWGTAIDINPSKNPYKGWGRSGGYIPGKTDMPENVKYLAMKYGFAQLGTDRMHFEAVSPSRRKAYAKELIEKGIISKDDPAILDLIKKKIITPEEYSKFKSPPPVPKPRRDETSSPPVPKSSGEVVPPKRKYISAEVSDSKIPSLSNNKMRAITEFLVGTPATSISTSPGKIKEYRTPIDLTPQPYLETPIDRTRQPYLETPIDPTS